MLDTNSNSFLEDQKAWLIKHSSAFGVLEKKKFQTQKRVKFLFLFLVVNCLKEEGILLKQSRERVIVYEVRLVI